MSRTGSQLPLLVLPFLPGKINTVISANIILSARRGGMAGDYAEDLAATMLATTLGVEFDLDNAWDERKEIFKMHNQIVRTSNITQSAIGDKKELWTTVIATAIFLPISHEE